ncbi:MAG: DUF4340 domain-containing protein [Mangrovibacterium sp.]
MFRKVNLKSLIILFVSLLLLVIIVNLMDQKKGNRSFERNLTEYQPDQISKILIYPKAMQAEKVELIKEKDQWVVISNNKKFKADQSLIQAMINSLNNLSPESLASNKKDRWGEYEVTDSLGTHVQLYAGEDLKTDLIFGKVSYSARSVRSYVRLAKENTVYRINGAQASEFNRDRDGFKDKTVINSAQSDWEKLSFSYPSDSSFVLVKSGDQWKIAEQTADSTEVVRFLNSIAKVNHYQLAKNEPEGTPDFRLTIEEQKMGTSVELKGYQKEDLFLLTSNQNPGVCFEGKALKEKLFPSPSKFIKKK